MAAGRRVIEVEIIGDASKLKRALGQADTAGSKWGSRLKRVGRAAAVGLGAGLGAAVVAGKKFVSQAEESIAIDKQTEAVLKSTGGAANVTASFVEKLSNQIQKKTGISDEDIQSTENMLLTFKGLRNEVGAGNDIFTQATRTATDMSVALGVDGTQSAIQLGKALNDPIKGITALSRVGVTFTDQQKKQIKTLVESGDTLGAQKIILKELTSEFGGSAEAQATSTGKMKAAIGDLTEKIGRALLPAYQSILTKAQGFVEGMTNGTGAGGKFVTTVKAIADILGKATKFLYDNRAALVAVAGGLAAAKAATLALKAGTAVAALATGGWTTKFWALNAAMRANPIGVVVTVIAALAAGIIYAYQKSDTFRSAVNALGNALKSVLSVAVKLVTKHLDLMGGVLSTVLRGIGHLPGLGFLKGAADGIDRAREKMRAFARSINDTPSNKNVSINIRQVTTTFENAARVPQRRAAGGLAGGATWVGEEGPELLELPSGSTVRNARQSRSRAAGASGAVQQTVNFNGPVGSQRAARVAASRLAFKLRFG